MVSAEPLKTSGLHVLFGNGVQLSVDPDPDYEAGNARGQVTCCLLLAWRRHCVVGLR
ncbi:hypothetical protein [Winogradskya humida]|uniref:Uncharacterized protein n=1 Tax=Winogradskya humida TaxID=113566 RepID=A0ABQ3ZM00_9ACTN|nr:hypothetical protein Ahu01nite_023240 [Actinoplanes humidus]